ncbi:ribonuclease H-like domain-containing protein [Tanacetum coccineum]
MRCEDSNRKLQFQLSRLCSMRGAVTTEEKTQKKNDVKDRSILMMALPKENLLTFNQYKDAKNLFAAIEARFGGNDAIKKTQKTLLKQMYENFNAPSTESLESIFNRLQKIINLEIMSFDDLYNNFKIVKQEVKRTTTSSSSSGSQNMAFVSTPSSTNDVNTADVLVSTTRSSFNTDSTQNNTANLSDAIVYAFLANQPNGSQLVHEDLEQIHEDDLEEIDLKWQLALLSMRARRYYQRTGKKITINGSDTAGYDKSKVECFNCHKMEHFARECKNPRSQESRARNHDNRNWSQDSSRRIVNVEEIAPKAIGAIDGAGFHCSFIAEEEVTTNMELMAFSDSEVYTDKTCSNTCLKSFEDLKNQLDNLRVEFNKSEFNLATYKRGLASIEEQLVFYKKNDIEKLKKEKESNQIKINKFENASKCLDKLIWSQISDNSRKGVGYNVVPPLPIGLFAPPTIDFSNSGLEEFQQPEFQGYRPKASKSVTDNQEKDKIEAKITKNEHGNGKSVKRSQSQSQIGKVKVKTEADIEEILNGPTHTHLMGWLGEQIENPIQLPPPDNRTMAQLLEAPTEGYEDAIVVPEITANNFELKHGLLTLVIQPPAYQAPPYQAPAPQIQGVSKEDFQAYVKANDAVMRNMQNQGQSLQNQLTNLTDMLSKFGTSNTASTSGSGSLPSNTVANPKGELKAITTRSGASYDGPQVSPSTSSLPKVVENEPEVTKDTVPRGAPMPNLKLTIPYPSRRNDERRREKANDQIEKFYEIFKDLSFEISLTDALILMPKFASTLKALIGNKEKLSEMARTPLNEHCSAVLLKKLPEKLRDPSKFLISCDFPEMDDLSHGRSWPSINHMSIDPCGKTISSRTYPYVMTLELGPNDCSRPIDDMTGRTESTSLKWALRSILKSSLSLGFSDVIRECKTHPLLGPKLSNLFSDSYSPSGDS